MPNEENQAILTMRGICKVFPGTKALDHVDFTLRKGEIHALMGENGAGKSTLIKVLTGVYPKDAGSIWVEGTQQADDRDPGQPEHTGTGKAGTVPVFTGCAADGGYRPGGGHEMQGADSGRTDILAGRERGGNAVRPDAGSEKPRRRHYLRHSFS